MYFVTFIFYQTGGYTDCVTLIMKKLKIYMGGVMLVESGGREIYMCISRWSTDTLLLRNTSHLVLSSVFSMLFSDNEGFSQFFTGQEDLREKHIPLWNEDLFLLKFIYGSHRN